MRERQPLCFFSMSPPFERRTPGRTTSPLACGKPALSQHSLVELGHSLRISTRFENQVLKKFHWNFPLALFY